MATTKRTVQFDLDFDVKNLKTIEELEDYVAGINEELKQVDINSDAFKQLSKQAQVANSQLKEIDESLGGVTSREKAEGFVKLGDAMVGAFQIAAGASLAFGEQTSEQIEKVIKQVGGLYAAMDGVRKITEAFGAENVKKMKAAITGFKSAAKAAKAFASTTRGALISTGIGALVVALGLIIANFDTIKQKAVELAKWLGDLFPPIKVLYDWVEKVADKLGSWTALLKGIGASLKAIFTFDWGNIGKAFEDAVEQQKELDALQQQYKETITDTTDEYEKQLELLSAQGDKEQEIIILKKKRLLQEQKILKGIKAQGNLTDEQKQRLKDINHQLSLLNIEQEKYNEKLKKERTERQKINKQNEESAKNSREELRKTMVAAGDLYMLNKKEIEDLQLKNKLLDQYVKEYSNYVKVESKVESKRFIARKRLLSDSIKTLKTEKDRYLIMQDIMKTDENLLGIYQEEDRIRNDARLSDKERKKQLDALETARIQYLAKVNYFLGEGYDLLTDEEKVKIDLLNLDYNRYIAQIKQNKQIMKIADENFKKNQENFKNLKHQYKDGFVDAKSEEAYNKRYNELIKEREAILTKKQEADKDNLKIQSEINGIVEERNNLYKNVAKSAAGEIQVQLTGMQKLREVVEQYSQEIQAGQDLIDNSFEIFYAAQENRIDKAMSDLDKWHDKYDSVLDEIAERKRQYASEEDRLNELLKDAEGDRYNDILAQMQQVQEQKEADAEKEKQIKNEEIKIQNRIIEAQNKEAKARKAQALIDAAIQTTIATIEALPNLILAGIVAAAGAVGIASIAARKVYQQPKIPLIKEEGGMILGNSHAGGGVPVIAEGGEYFVNKNSAQQFLPLLDAINNTGNNDVASATPNAPTPSTDIIDYDRLGRIIANQNIFVSVTEFNDVANRLKVVENRSSI